MPATRLEMRGEVLYIIGNRTDIATSVIDDWIRRSYQHITQSVEFPEAYSTVSQPMVIGTRAYTLPPDYFSVYSVRNNTADHKVIQVSQDAYNSLRTTLDGPVVQYAIFNQTFKVHATPATAESIQIDYRKIFADLTTDASAHVLPDSWDHPIIHLAAGYGFDHLNEMERARHYKAEARRHIREQASRLATELIDRNEAMGVIGGGIR